MMRLDDPASADNVAQPRLDLRGIGHLAQQLSDVLKPLGIRVRAGVHSGEVELAPGDVRGVAVHATARIMALAAPDEVWVSATVRELVDGTGLAFADRGLHELKGITGQRQLYSLVRPGSAPVGPLAGED